MLELLYSVILYFSLVTGGLLVVLGLFGRLPGNFEVTMMVGVEISLLVQLITSIVLVASGERAVISTLEFFGYLIVALMIPAAGVIWSLIERNRWSTVIMGAAALTVSVMMVRMMQIWTGVSPVAS